MSEYSSPVAALIERGDNHSGYVWPDYVAENGLDSSHVPDLIRMVTDPELYDSPEVTEAYATIHARRALGQLRATEAIEPLFAAMRSQIEDDDDWFEDMPRIMEMMGPASIIPAIRHMTDPRFDSYGRGLCAEILQRVAAAYPETREECITSLMSVLSRLEDDENAWFMNAQIVGALCDLKAVEAMPIIERAFAADVVDESLRGGLATARYTMGLGPEPEDNDIRPQWSLISPFRPPPTRPNRPDPQKLLKKLKSQKLKSRRKR